MNRVVIIGVAILLLVQSVLFAAGGEETPPAPDELSLEDGPSTEEDLQATDRADQTMLDELVPLDQATAEILYSMNVTPFPDKIPSEDFALDTLGGGQTQLSDHFGKVVFLNFWATWCPPCREEMPSMQILYNELNEEGLEILAVDVQEGEAVVTEFVDEFKFTYPILMDRDGRVTARYAIRAFPTTYIIDRAGYIIGVRVGYNDWSSVEIVEGFRMLLAGK